MKKFLSVLACVLVAVLFWIIIPENGRVETVDCGNSIQLVKKTSTFCGLERTHYGLRKNGTDLLAPSHEMVENEHLKLRVFYGLNAKVHVFDKETGEKVMTGWVHGRNAETVWFCLDDNKTYDSYLLLAHYKVSASPVQMRTDTIAVFEENNGKAKLVKVL